MNLLIWSLNVWRLILSTSRNLRNERPKHGHVRSFPGQPGHANHRINWPIQPRMRLIRKLQLCRLPPVDRGHAQLLGPICGEVSASRLLLELVARCNGHDGVRLGAVPLRGAFGRAGDAVPVEATDPVAFLDLVEGAIQIDLRVFLTGAW